MLAVDISFELCQKVSDTIFDSQSSGQREDIRLKRTRNPLARARTMRTMTTAPRIGLIARARKPKETDARARTNDCESHLKHMGATMKASKIIEALQKAVEKHGDLEVVQGGWADWNHYSPVKASPTPVKCKRHYSGYVPVKALDTGGYAGGPKFREPYQTEIKNSKSILVMHL